MADPAHIQALLGTNHASPRDLQRLVGVHPKLSASILQILDQLPMFVVCGVRTTAEQHALYGQGRTQPGHIVTHDDGVIHRSNHQIHLSDGLGHAVDCAWLGADPWGSTQPWLSYGLLVRAAGLTWGGDWKTFIDRPHAELP